MSTLAQLIDQAQKLNRQIEELRQAQCAQAVAEIQELMKLHGLTAADLAEATEKPKRATLKGKPVAAKYADGNGNSWSGRGLKPRWLVAALDDGKKLEDFAV